MKSERYPIEKSSWFIMKRGTGEYLDYGFKSKAQALTEVSFLNARERVEGREGLYGVTPSRPRPPPDLRVLKGGQS